VHSHVDGNLVVKATSEEDITSVAAGISAAGGAAVTVDASVHVIGTQTRAFIGDDPDDATASLGAGDVLAQGTVIVSADDRTELDKVVGALSAAGSFAGTASGAVTVLNKNTQSFIGAGAKVQGNGATGLTGNTGGFQYTVTPEAHQSDAQQGIGTESYGAGTSGQPEERRRGRHALAHRHRLGQVDDGSGGSGRSNPPPAAPRWAIPLASRRPPHPERVAVTATNRDDVEAFAVGLSAAGGAAVALSAASTWSTRTPRPTSAPTRW